MWGEIISIVFACAVMHANAALSISNTLGSHMVLQRAPYSNQVYGIADPSASIKVSFNAQAYQTTADSEGNWNVTIPPTPAGGPFSIDVASSSGETATLDDVLFGDVWLCGGQSNMQFTVIQAYNGSVEANNANNYPNIRLFSVGQGTLSSTPLTQLKTIDLPWSVSSNVTVGAAAWSHFSAVCWFFGKELYDRDNTVPIGLISSNWGGTYIEQWSSPLSLQECNSAPIPGVISSALYNAMIVPFLKTTILGAIWYQGESNSIAPNPANYDCQQQAMINDWRANWGYDFTFIITQLAPWVDATHSLVVAEIRALQMGALKLPKVGLATAIDLGDVNSPWTNIHPRNKQEVGRRLSLVADSIVYQRSDAWLGPIYKNWTTVMDGSTAIVNVSFHIEGNIGPLQVTETTCPDGVDSQCCSNFLFLFSDGTWWPSSTAKLVTEDTIQLYVPNVLKGESVTGVSYAWSIWPLVTIYSATTGLPAYPFIV